MIFIHFEPRISNKWVNGHRFIMHRRRRVVKRPSIGTLHFAKRNVVVSGSPAAECRLLSSRVLMHCIACTWSPLYYPKTDQAHRGMVGRSGAREHVYAFDSKWFCVEFHHVYSRPGPDTTTKKATLSHDFGKISPSTDSGPRCSRPRSLL